MFQFVINAQLFSRICGRDNHILEATSMFAEKAASIDSTSSAAMAEVGRQCLLRSRTKEAQKYYKVCKGNSKAENTYFIRGSINVPMADLLFYFFGFSSLAYVELVSD